MTRGTGFSTPPKRRPLTQRTVKLVPREDVAMEHRPALLPGRKSKRARRRVWIPA